MKAYLQICSVLFPTLLAAGAAAQELGAPPNGPENVYVPAEPLNRSAPSYPTQALYQRREGWVMVSFIISEEGEVIEPMIEDSSSSDFDDSALRAIRNWRYKPATLGGKPVEQSMVQTIIRYKMAEAKGASGKFVNKYRAITKLIADKSFAEAGSSLDALGEGELNYYEQAWLWWLRYVYLDATGTAEPAALEEALRKALGSSQEKSDDYLQPDVFVSAAQRLYVLRARNADLSGAVTVFEQLKASDTAKRSKVYEQMVAALEPSYEEIMRLVAGSGVLRQMARVDEHNYWVHRMLRRSFALADVESGKLDVVDVRCKRANRRFLSIPDNAVLRIPDTWGDCSVYVKGDVGTTFAFEEYPAGYSRALDPEQVPATEQ
jgi:TonB family protein